jgi:hypothetical protein
MSSGETPGDVLRDAFSRLAAVNTDKLSAIRFLVFVCGGCPVTEFLIQGLRTLVELSSTEVHGVQIVEEGAVQKLVKLLSNSEDQTVLSNASETLCNLAQHEGTRAAMIKEGAVRFLVQTCSKLEARVPLAHCALALSYLALDETAPTKFMEENAVGSLIELIKRSSDTVWYDVQHNAALALSNLATHAESTAHLLERGAIPPLVKLCASSEQDNVVTAVTAALANLAKQEGTRAQLLQEGAVKPLVMLCRLTHVNSVSAGSEDDEAGEGVRGGSLPVLQNSCRALQLLSCYKTGRPQLVEQGTVTALSQLLRTSADVNVLLDAALCLRNLAAHEGSRKMMIDDGSAEALVLLCSRSEDKVFAAAAEALVNLSLHMGSGKRMVEVGAVVPLVKLMNRTQSDRLKANCAAAVANMAGGAGEAEEVAEGQQTTTMVMVEQGVIEPLVYLCMSSKNVRVLGNAAGALVNLARDKKCVSAIVKAGGLQPLVALCKGGDEGQVRDEVVLSNAAQALVNIASDEASRKEVMSEGGLEALIMICLHSDDERVLGYAAQALAELAAEREQRLVMAQQGAVAPLVALLATSTDKGILEAAALGLRNLSSSTPTAKSSTSTAAAAPPAPNAPGSADASASVREMIVAAGAVGALVKACKGVTTTGTKIAEHAAVALVQLGQHQPSAAALVEGAAVPAIVALCVQCSGRDDEVSGTSSTWLLAEATEALRNLASERSSRSQMVQDGCVRPLSELLGHSTSNLIRGNLCHMLRQLSYEERCRLHMVQDGCLWPLVKLCSMGPTGSGAGGGDAGDGSAGRCDNRTLEHACGALVNLALDETSRGLIVQEGAVPPLVQLLRPMETDLEDGDGDSGEAIGGNAEAENGVKRGGGVAASVVGNAANALANLAVRAASAPVIIEEGAVAPLVLLCSRAKESKLLISAALALSKLALLMGEKVQAEAGDSALNALARARRKLGFRVPAFLVQPLAGAIASLAPQEAVLLPGDELPGEEGGSAKAVSSFQCDAVRPLVELLLNSHEPTMLANSCRALAELAAPEGTGKAIVVEGSVAALVQVLSRAEVWQDVALLFNAAECIRNLSRQEAVRAQVVLDGSVKPLVRMALDRTAIDGGSEGAEGAEGANAEESMMDQMQGEGGETAIDRHLGQLPPKQRQAIRLMSRDALCQLGLDALSGPRMVLEGAVTCIVQTIYTCSSDAAYAKTGPNARPGGQKAAVDDAGGASSRLLATATQALSQLALDQHSRLRIADDGALPPLVALCANLNERSATNVPVLANASGALGVLAREAPLRGRLLQCGGVAALVQLSLSCSDQLVLANVCSALANMAQHAGCREEMMKEGGAQPLTMLIANSSDNQVLLGATLALVNLCKDKRSRPLLVAQGLVKPLAELIQRSHDSRVLAQAASILASVSRDQSSRIAVATQGGALRPLIHLCSTSADPHVLSNSLQALRNLAGHPEVRTQIIKRGAIRGLVMLCDTHDSPLVLEHAAGTLANLAFDDDSSAAAAGGGGGAADDPEADGARTDGADGVSAAGGVLMVKAGAVAPLIRLCTTRTESKVLRNSAAALTNLSLLEAHTASLVKEGLVGALVQLCALEPPDPVVHGCAAQLFRNVARHVPSRPVLVEQGAVKAIVTLCEKQGASVEGADGDASLGSNQVLADAAQALVNLAVDESSRERIVLDGAVMPLVLLCASSQDPIVLGYAAGALANLALHEGSRLPIVQQGAVRPLTELCGSARELKLLRYATAALVNLALDMEARASMVKEGAVPPLVHLLITSQDNIVLGNAAQALRNMARDEGSRERIISDGAVGCLVQLCSRALATRVFANAAEALTNLALHTAAARRLVEEGVARPLVQLCGRSQDPRVLGNAALALAKLAAEDDVRAALLKQGVLTPLLRLCRESKDGTVLSNAAQALRNLSKQNNARPQLVAQGILGPVLELCRSCPEGKVVVQAAGVLVNLACHEACRSKIISEQALPTLIALCLKSHDTGVLANAAQVLANLAVRSEARQQIVKEGAVTALAKLCMRSQDRKVLRNAAAAMVNLAGDAGCHVRMVQEGAIPPLIHLLTQAPDVSVKGYAAGALANIALHVDSRSKIVEAGAITPLVQLCDEEHKKRQHTLQQLELAEVREGSSMTPAALKEAARGIKASTQVIGHATQALISLAIEEGAREQLVREGACAPIIRLCETAAPAPEGEKATATTEPEKQADHEAAVREGGWLGEEEDGKGGTALIGEAAEQAKAVVADQSEADAKKRAAAAKKRRQRQADAVDEMVLRAAVETLRNFALDEPSRPTIIDAGAVPVLGRLCVRPSKSQAAQGNGSAEVSEGMDVLMVGYCVQALRTLARHAPSRAIMAAQHCIPPLVTLLCNSRDPALLEHACGALVNLALDEGNRSIVLADGATAPLVMLCLKSQDARVLGNAAGALANLARDESAVPQLVDEGAARPLVHLCQRSNDGQVLVCAALALSRMAVVMGKRFEVAAGGRGAECLQRVQQVLGHGMPPYLIQPLSQAISVLADKASAVTSGAIQPLVRLLQESQEVPSLASAAAAIAELALKPDSAEGVVAEGGAKVLVQLLSRTEEERVLAPVCEALHNLAANEKTRGRLVLEGAVQPLSRVCRRFRGGSVLHFASLAIAQLAQDVTSAARVAANGGVKPLVELCARSQVSTELRAATQGLVNFALHDGSRHMIVNEGGVGPLASLCETCDDNIVIRNAAHAMRYVLLFRYLLSMLHF